MRKVKVNVLKREWTRPKNRKCIKKCTQIRWSGVDIRFFFTLNSKLGNWLFMIDNYWIFIKDFSSWGREWGRWPYSEGHFKKIPLILDACSFEAEGSWHSKASRTVTLWTIVMHPKSSASGKQPLLVPHALQLHPVFCSPLYKTQNSCLYSWSPIPLLIFSWMLSN